MNEVCFLADSEEQTERLGRALASCLPDGTVISLIGTLGAGKTRLVQAVAAACGIPREQAVSPTFVLCHEYIGRRTIYHFDAYRLRDSSEFNSIGAEEYLWSSALTFVEWADRVMDALPSDRIEVRIEIESETARRFWIRADGEALRDFPSMILKKLGDGAPG